LLCMLQADRVHHWIRRHTANSRWYLHWWWVCDL